jgi:molecular chaperone DnaK
MDTILGIDLGTTYSVAAVFEDGRARIVPNREGDALTPSVYAETRRHHPLVGVVAKAQAAANPQNTVLSIKRRMGTDYRVRIHGRACSPQEISSFILRKIKADAEHALGRRVEKAVITVPAYFSDTQRQATREAGLMAGLDVVRMINEPTAAALAYGLDRKNVQSVLVWDLGGGTFDVSILEMGDGVFQVRAVNGDCYLGGDDWDQRIMTYAAEAFRTAYGVDLQPDSGDWQRLRTVCEKAKKELSLEPATQIRLSLVGRNGKPIVRLACPFSRDILEQITGDLRERMAQATHRALKDAGLGPEAMDCIVLVGGATRMPAIKALAVEIFGKEPYQGINPDEAVAIGAAIQGGVLAGMVQHVALVDVVPLSLGVETQGGIFSIVIPRNTPVPTSADRIFTTAVDGQSEMDINVLQGERAMASDNISLGCFKLAQIPPMPRGKAQVEMIFRIDASGVVTVTAQEIFTGAEASICIDAVHRLSDDKVRALIREAEARAVSDRKRKHAIELSIRAEQALRAGQALLEQTATHGCRDVIERALYSVQDALARGDTTGIEKEMETLNGLLQVR